MIPAPKVSVMMLTIDRFDVTSKCFEENIKRARQGCPDAWFEFLVCDNGSKDRRIVNYFYDLGNGQQGYHRINSRNEGVGKAFNQLYLRSQGDILVFMGNDILMPAMWLEQALHYLRVVPNPGIVGFNWGHSGIPPTTSKFGIEAPWLNAQLNRVFGTWVMKRELVEKLGLFHEGYDVYGIEDSDFNERVNRSEHNSLYVPNLLSSHLVNDVGEDSEYRRTKDASLSKNLGIFCERVKAFDSGATLVEPLPTMRDPL